jgi:hypothetical protein
VPVNVVATGRNGVFTGVRNATVCSETVAVDLFEHALSPVPLSATFATILG